MTGFGREHIVANGREIIVEIRSVNHRYYEFTSRTPRAYGYLDEKLKGFLKSGISRGKVEASVSIYNQEGTDAEIELNKAVAKGYLDALRGAADELDLDDDITLSHIMKLPDVFTVVKKTDDEEVIWNEVKDVAQVALDRFVQMRETEGVKMYDDISGRLDYIEETVGKIEDQSPSVTESYRERLYAKIKETLGDKDIDEQRILTEVAIFADKVAIDEETVKAQKPYLTVQRAYQVGRACGKKA